MTSADIVEAPKPRVFLSYARVDRAVAARLADTLSAQGIDLWWDAAIETGARFSADIERELAAADAVVVLWSAASVQSTWVLDEAAAGRDRGRLVPVLLDATLPPLGFRQFHATDLAGWKGRAGDPRIGALVAAVHKLADGAQAGPASVSPTVHAPASGPSRPSRRQLIGGAAGLAVLAAAGVGAYRFRAAPAMAGTATIAVMPFANLSGDPAQAYFSDGLSEELRSALGQIPGVQVIGRTSSERFREVDDPLEVARQLKVSHVLTGSVRRSPATIRISARLIDGQTGRETWAQDYDRPAGDALVIQSSIATAVLGALNKLVGTGAQAITVGGTRNAEAQALFLQGSTYAQADVDEAQYLRRIARLDAAIALDPNYAEAWRFKAIALGGVESFKTDHAAAMTYRQAALAAAARAVEIEPSSARLLGTLAQQLMLNLKMRDAIATAQQAVRIAARNGTYSAAISRVLNAVDPARALDLVNAHIAFDSLDEFAYDVRAESLFNLGRMEEALADGRKAHALSNGYRGQAMILRALTALGRFDEARRLPWLDKGRGLQAALVEARAGDAARADALMAGMGGIDPRLLGYSRALVLAQLGRTDAALAELEAGIGNVDLGLARIAFDPFLDPMRGTPRFRAVQDKVIPPDLLVGEKGA